MKKMKKFFALLIAMAMVLGMSMSVFAASITINSTADPDETATDTTQYTYYKILDASIEDASKITVNPETGASTAGTGEDAPKVSYYVTTQAKADALSGTGLFNVVADESTTPVAKWFVELKNENTSAEDIAAALQGIKTTFADASGTFAQTTPGGSAKKDGLDPGYYLIESTLGDVLAVQTLADITINTKNEYPPTEKTVDETDKSAQIGDEISYTLTVEVPQSANDTIVLTDTMSAGLTFKSIDSVKAGDADVAYTLDPAAPAESDKTFKITFTKETVAANKGKTITIKYTAILNENAVVDAADSEDDDSTGNDNTLELQYGNNYKSVPKIVEVDTQKFTFDKIDGSDNTKLPGAVFELQLNGTALKLVEVKAGEEYRIATENDKETVTSITTTGKVVTINGVDADVTYTLKETQAPTGYNMPENPETEVKASTDNALAITIKNNKGSVLPSTGGIGTTIFYIVGAMLVIGAGVVLVTRRRMDAQ